MLSFFALLVLGHLVGDYLLQNNWMAQRKSGNTWPCLLHCLLYTVAVVGFTWPYIHGWLWAALVFASHFPIDRWTLADKYAKLIGGRSLTVYLKEGHKDMPYGSSEERSNYHALRGGFTAFCYIAIDNTMHLVLMYLGALLLASL